MGSTGARIDDWVGNADAFPVLRKRDFFNHAGVAALPRAAGDALRKYADEAESDVYIGTKWHIDIRKASRDVRLR